MTLIAETNVFCRRCGKALYSEKGKAKGIGSTCERKEKRERKIKPYIQETKCVESALINDDGSIFYLERCYPESDNWSDPF